MLLADDGPRLVTPDGECVAVFTDPALAAKIAKAYNSIEHLATDIEELLIACGLDYARTLSAHEALAEATRQVRMVRQTVAGARMTMRDHSS